MKQLYFYNGEAYVILRALKASYLYDKTGEFKRDLLLLWKEGFGADHVLKTESHFLLCETIKEPEWEEIYDQEESIPEPSA
jgi:hypothetical protein